MSDNIELCLARVGDAYPISQMSRSLIEHGLGWTWRPERIVKHIRSPESVVLTAKDGKRLVGFAIMGFFDSKAHLYLMAVSEHYRRRGVGRRLLSWLVESAAVAGIGRISLEFRVKNDAAHAFYRAVGFQGAQRLRRYYHGKEDALRMYRQISVSVDEPWDPIAYLRKTIFQPNT